MTTTANHGCPTPRRLPLPIMCQNINPGPASGNRVPIATIIPPVSRLLPLSQLLRLELTFCLQLPAVDGTLDSPPCVSTTAPNTMARNTGAPPLLILPPIPPSRSKQSLPPGPSIPNPTFAADPKPQHRRLALTPALQFDAVEEPPTIGIGMDTIARGSSMCQQGQVGLVFVRKARCGMGETSS